MTVGSDDDDSSSKICGRPPLLPRPSSESGGGHHCVTSSPSTDIDDTTAVMKAAPSPTVLHLKVAVDTRRQCFTCTHELHASNQGKCVQKDCGVLGRKKKKWHASGETWRESGRRAAFCFGGSNNVPKLARRANQTYRSLHFFSILLFLSIALLIFHPRVPLRV